MGFQREIEWLVKEKYGGKTTQRALKHIERIMQGEPVAYVIGFVEFLGCRIDLSKRPMIPRPETEYWVTAVLEGMHTSHIHCLDMFTGSGCIGVALLKHVPDSTVDFADINKKNLEQAKINAELNNIAASRCKVIMSDIFSCIESTYDYIFANPPYIALARKSNVQASVLQWENPTALFGGRDGLKYIQPFLRDAKLYLTPGGKIYMEYDSFQKRNIAKLLKHYGYKQWEFFKDQYEKWRYVVAMI